MISIYFNFSGELISYKFTSFRSSHRRWSVKNGFLEISQNSQENTCARVSFLILWHRCFPVNFTKFLRAPFLQNTSGRVLVKFTMCKFIIYRSKTLIFKPELLLFLSESSGLYLKAKVCIWTKMKSFRHEIFSFCKCV